MSQLSQREAALKWGVSRATLQRKIKAGEVSVTGDKLIDPSEMLRVFGEPKSRPKGRSSEPVEPPSGPVEPARLSEVDRLRIELEGKDRLIAEQAARIDDLRQAMRLLEHQRPAEPAKEPAKKPGVLRRLFGGS